MKSVKSEAQIRKAQAQLKKLRNEIDKVDRLFMKELAKRFRVVREVGLLKNKFGFPIHQKSRMNEMLNGRRDDAARLKLDGKLVYNIFDLIHEASIVCQEEIVKKAAQKKKAAKRNNKTAHKINKKVG